MKLVVGLGNTGQGYRWTRHNMGFWLIEAFAQNQGIALSRRGFQSVYGRGRVGPENVILAKPQTYMNLSGEAVRQLLPFFRIPPHDLIVLQDDLDLPIGHIRIRLRGGDGGHQGIRSIIEAIGSQNFTRLKMGIGRPAVAHQDPVDFVLEPLKKNEKEALQEAVERASQVIEVIILEGPQEAMNRFHQDR